MKSYRADLWQILNQSTSGYETMDVESGRLRINGKALHRVEAVSSHAQSGGVFNHASIMDAVAALPTEGGLVDVDVDVDLAGTECHINKSDVALVSFNRSRIRFNGVSVVRGRHSLGSGTVVENLLFRGIIIDGNGGWYNSSLAEEDHGIILDNCRNAWVQDCMFIDNGDEALEFAKGSEWCVSMRNQFINSSTKSYDGSSIGINHARNITSIHDWIRSSNAAGYCLRTPGGLAQPAIENIRIIAPTIENVAVTASGPEGFSGIGIEFDPIDGGICRDITVIDAKFINCAYAAIRRQSATGDHSDQKIIRPIIIGGGTFAYTAVQAAIQMHVGNHPAVIEDAVIRGWGESQAATNSSKIVGIRAFGDIVRPKIYYEGGTRMDKGVWLSGGPGVGARCEGAYIEGVGDATSFTDRAAVVVAHWDGVVRDLRTNDCYNHLKITAVEDVRIEGGSVRTPRGAATSLISDAGTRTRIKDVAGFRLEARGIATLPNSGGTVVLVNHGLVAGAFSSAAGDHFFVTPITALGAATKWWVTRESDTQFAIRVDAAPGVDVNFAWWAHRAQAVAP